MKPVCKGHLFIAANVLVLFCWSLYTGLTVDIYKGHLIIVTNMRVFVAIIQRVNYDIMEQTYLFIAADLHA